MSTARAPRITLRIDRIVCDGASLDAPALEAALHAALYQHYADHGQAGWPASLHLAGGRVALGQGDAPLASRVAGAVIAATGRGPK